MIKTEHSRRWINALLALAALIMGFIAFKFLGQLGEWFDLESKISNYMIYVQVASVLVGALTFFIVLKSEVAMLYLNEVYSELVKVIWPERDPTIKLTVGILVAVSITAAVFVLIDYIFNALLSLVY